MSGSEDDVDLLAGEYALGCLDSAEMQALEARAAADVTLQRSIQRWVGRLAPLSTTVRPLAPPADLWARLQASINGHASAAVPIAPPQTLAPPVSVRPVVAGPAPATHRLLPDNIMPLRAPRPVVRPRFWQEAGFWRATTAAAMAVAAVLAGIIVLRPPPPGGFVATLTAPGGPAPGFIARSQPDGAILVTALEAPPAVPGRDLELWALPQGATRPISLGVMPVSGRRVEAANLPRDQTQLMLSLEPAGGSPTGQPTGPVIYAGKLTSLN